MPVQHALQTVCPAKHVQTCYDDNYPRPPRLLRMPGQLRPSQSWACSLETSLSAVRPQLLMLMFSAYTTAKLLCAFARLACMAGWLGQCSSLA